MILIHPDEVDAAGLCTLTDVRARHIRKVLKAEAGKSLKIGLANGPLGTGVVEASKLDRVVLKCSFEQGAPLQPAIDLLLAMPRPKVMKRLWAQLAALGIGKVVLVRADKVERYYFDSHVLDPGYYEPLLIEGLQQARCTHLPEVLVRPLFKPFVEDELDPLFADHTKLLADPSGHKRLAEFFGKGAPHERIVLAIGPEGGWTSYELEMLTKRGFQLFSMGNRILRTDTATVGLLTCLQQYLTAS